ncbi:unnamed protein product, partial [Brugia timori]|uniref:Uncharacterized protein n=1 Tax=Brugia timori TaxID=42155 RepID=A0A0R3R243_9BILA
MNGDEMKSLLRFSKQFLRYSNNTADKIPVQLIHCF